MVVFPSAYGLKVMRRVGKVFWLVSILLASLVGCSQPDEDVVVVYTSQDQLYASQVLDDFERETGIRVLPLFDSESVKTTGLINRLKAESRRPRCDVFWSNEELMVQRLCQMGVTLESELKTFGYRTRRLVVNTNLVARGDVPASLAELVDEKWRGKVALAYPLYGTTITHLLALRAEWGQERWETWCRKLLRNEALVVDGNSAVVRLVGQGRAALGLTDSDDIAVGLRNGLPIRMVDRVAGFPVIRNSAVLVDGAPHAENGLKLIEYLQGNKTVARLQELGALEGTEPNGDELWSVSWDRVMPEFDDAYKWLGDVFFREGESR